MNFKYWDLVVKKIDNGIIKKEFIVYDVYPKNMMSLCLYWCDDVEQDFQVKQDDYIKIK